MLKQRFSWTDQNFARTVEMWSKGYSISDISLALGVQRGAVSGLMTRNRDVLPKRGGAGKPAHIQIDRVRKSPRVDWTEALIEKAQELWNAHLTAAQIATELGSTVHAFNSLAIRMRERFPKRGYVLQARALATTKQVQATQRAETAAAAGISQTISQSNARRKAAKDNQERIAAGLPPITHHKLITDFSVFAIEGITSTTLLLVTDKQCRFPIASNDDPIDGDMPVCGGEATHGSYCSHHASISRGQGNRAEQHAIDGVGGRRA
jgi:hypothetical protein